MKKKLIYILLVIVVVFTGCEDKWTEHYEDVPETIDMNIWDAIKENPDLSAFVSVLEQNKYDTLFNTNSTFSLFIPSNQAFSIYTDTAEITEQLLKYHLSPHFIISQNIIGKRKVQTLGEKYALFENNGQQVTLDNKILNFESPLYRNGKYFILDQVAEPLPNIYEFITENLPILKTYIDDKDSLIIDKEKSRPLGFDDEGNTIYDTVSIKFNLFELEYFPVSEELRNKTATFVFPSQNDYNKALTDFALQLGGSYTNYSDIPLDWQLKVLVPYLIENGVFENMMEPDEFISGITDNNDTLKVKNILGDSIVIEYQPVGKVLCSNGYVYAYDEFFIPDTFMNGAVRIEGESLLETKGAFNFAWKEEIRVTSDISVKPTKELIPTASNDSILKAQFTDLYQGAYSVEWKIKNLFPRKYLMVVNTNTLFGGIFDIYINNELVKTVNYYDQFQNVDQEPNTSLSVTGKYYKVKNGFNLFDCWVTNDAPYGEAVIRIDYKGPGEHIEFFQKQILNGLSIDYIDFIPQTN